MQLCWWRFADVDYFITINIHTRPLNLRCRWRLVQKHMLSRSWTNVARPCFLLKQLVLAKYQLLCLSAVGLLQKDDECLRLHSKVIKNVHLACNEVFDVQLENSEWVFGTCWQCALKRKVFSWHCPVLKRTFAD